MIAAEAAMIAAEAAMIAAEAAMIAAVMTALAPGLPVPARRVICKEHRLRLSTGSSAYADEPPSERHGGCCCSAYHPLIHNLNLSRKEG
ncbi:hypothetical protein [Mycobacterium sp.]|uniref:hypothetical protein n=1 Tax=Mycobacterium sp. TaxID=1785 RepID=UPI0025CFB530|nr:hypothetical protein [Mycobacterium sp.]